MFDVNGGVPTHTSILTVIVSFYFTLSYPLFLFYHFFLVELLFILLNYFLNYFQSVNQHVDLNFRAINYSAEVYLNGHKKVLPKGMFRRHSLDVTDILDPNGQNLLAVLVHPPDHPGKIPPEGGQGGDHKVYIFIPYILRAHLVQVLEKKLVFEIPFLCLVKTEILLSCH